MCDIYKCFFLVFVKIKKTPRIVRVNATWKAGPIDKEWWIKKKRVLFREGPSSFFWEGTISWNISFILSLRETEGNERNVWFLWWRLISDIFRCLAVIFSFQVLLFETFLWSLLSDCFFIIRKNMWLLNENMVMTNWKHENDQKMRYSWKHLYKTR